MEKLNSSYNKLIVLVCIVLIPATLGGDYCGSKYKKVCEYKGDHVGCHPKDFSHYSSCSGLHPRMIKITPSYKKYILSQHNSLRNKLASGTMSSRGGTFPSASNMSVLQWDDELAKLAELNVKQCTMNHDQCRSTLKFKDAGQNIFYTSWSEKRTKRKPLIKEGIKAWWTEHEDFILHEVDKYEGQSRGVLHFTAMSLDYQTHVGCAISMYDYHTSGDTFLFTCNYSSWTWMSQAIYKKGTPCSKCAGKKCDKTYKNLCSAKS